MALTPLPVNLDELVEAMTWSDFMLETYRYLDRETGDVLTIEADEFGEDGLDEDEEDGEGDLSEDEKEAKAQMKLIDENPERFIAVDRIESHESFRIMEDFVDEVKSETVRRRLMRALTGRRKPFRAFKSALEEFPEVRQQWFAYQEEREFAMARDWLAANGIETTWTCPRKKAK